MNDVTYHNPLVWPATQPRTRHPEYNSRFQTTLYNVARGLENELRLLEASDAVISSNGKLVMSGARLASTQPIIADPGVAVYFNLDGHEYVLACDAWALLVDNLHAIGRTINAFRGIERWGVSQVMERMFSGFTALPAPKMWNQVLGVDRTKTSRDEVTRIYKVMAKTMHPDKGGDPERFRELNEAYEAAMKELAHV